MSQSTNPFPFAGLSDAEVTASRALHGLNETDGDRRSTLWPALKETVTEPMFLLLTAVTLIYFLLNEIPEGLFMLAAITVISAISFYQDNRSRKALEALRVLSETRCRVIRNNHVVELPGSALVPGDFVIVREGDLIAADGDIVQANDFSVNESILTGEAFPVSKNTLGDETHFVFKGTLAVGGLAVYRITATGGSTRFGKIELSLQQVTADKTPLQEQISRFVRLMAVMGMVVFLLIWGYHYYLTHALLDSLLKGLTIAMSVLPEEIPVAFTSFMALGAWRLMQRGIIVKNTRTVEALGSATVICTDKTGTLTENRMELAGAYVHQSGKTIEGKVWDNDDAHPLITLAMWASEPVPFDPMETALHEAYSRTAKLDLRPSYRMVHEYPLSGRPPMMTHVFEHAEGHRIIACKGATEAILERTALNEDEKKKVMRIADSFAVKGYRVLAVGESGFKGNEFKKEQQEYTFDFVGLVAFYDPPKHNTAEVLSAFYSAGIHVKIITGDNAVTTAAIAAQCGFREAEKQISGSELMTLNEQELDQAVAENSVFTRMFPEAKLRIIEALKKQGAVVAMTGDGVNDAPALKSAHIGIAMGKRGSEPARQAAALILTDDDLGRMTEAIEAGRKIYDNLKKAVRYIISIHIPILLTVALPLLLGWAYPVLFTPVHVIFLELIMGPTCSLAFENEPAEEGLMQRPPRPLTQNFLQWSELRLSVFQGLVITAGLMILYQIAVMQGESENTVRTMVFTALVTANILLTLVNRSFYRSIFISMQKSNMLLYALLAATALMLAALLTFAPLQQFFGFEFPERSELLMSLGTGAASVLWFELFKAVRRNKKV